jgi:hypothetical protein
MAKWDFDIKVQTTGVLKRLDTLAEVMAAARAAYGVAKVKFERAKEDHSVVVRKRLFELVSQPENQGLIDPRTGKSNQDWTKLVIDNAMDSDPAVMESYIKLTTARDVVATEENNVLNISDEIGILKTSARLLTAIMHFAAEDIPA